MEELDLKELFTIFWNKKLEIVLITLIAIAIGVVYSFFFIVPEYKASATLVLVQSSATVEQSGQGITQTDLTLNSKLVSTYSEIMKSKAVLSQVVAGIGKPEVTEENIRNNISVQSRKDTEVIEITVKNLDPNTAALIANKIAEVFSEKIVEIYNISNIYVLDRAEPSENPSNVNHTKDLVIFAFIGIVISVGFVLVLNMLDTTIKTEQDVENSTGLLVLSSIPNYEVENKRKKGGRR
jgi:capsular polysaccharide biosynthesis protein